MRRSTKTLALTLTAVTLPLLAGCNGAELESLRASNVAKDQEVADAQAAAKADVARVELEKTSLEYDFETQRTKLSQQLDTARSDLATSQGALSEAQALADSAEDKIETAEKQCDEYAGHRDELIEWINDELLPLAEKQDPKLAKLKEMTDEAAAEVERLRGLKFKRPFMRRLIKRDKVRDFLARDMRRELPEEDAEEMMAVMAEFGLVEPGANLFDMFEQFLEGGAAAFYKPNTGTFYLIEGNFGDGDRPTIFHELVHAVEDQHFDLTLLQKAFEEDSDGGMGVKALVEGSAESWTNVYNKEHPEHAAASMKAQMTPELLAKQGQMLQQVPAFLIAAMGLYPYKNGAAWLTGIKADTPAEIDALFRGPPVSTEIILHPEKYGKDYPHAIAAPALDGVLGADWEVLDDDSMGELFAGLMLSGLQWGPKGPLALRNMMDMRTQGVGFKKPVKAAVEGWDGDRYTAARRTDGSVCVVWTSVWDSDVDATEFGSLYAKLLAKQINGKAEAQDLPARFEKSGGGVTGVDVDGRRVVVVLNGPAAVADALFAAGHASEITPDERDINDR